MASTLLAAPPALPGETEAFLRRVDLLREEANQHLTLDRKTALGQFFTPTLVARRMAAMLTLEDSAIRILDAGAGVGSLFSACVAQLCSRPKLPEEISVVAYEVDEALAVYLQQSLQLCAELCAQVGIRFVGVLLQADFIGSVAESINGNLF